MPRTLAASASRGKARKSVGHGAGGPADRVFLLCFACSAALGIIPSLNDIVRVRCLQPLKHPSLL